MALPSFRHLITVSTVIWSCLVSPSVLAQNKSFQEAIGGDWINKPTNVSYYWKDPRGETRFSHELFIQITNNTIRLFRSFTLRQLGGAYRCGGVGCDQSIGENIATITLDGQGPNFQVVKATGEGGFLVGAHCFITKEIVSSFRCRGSQFPVKTLEGTWLEGPAIFDFIFRP